MSRIRGFGLLRCTESSLPVELARASSCVLLLNEKANIGKTKETPLEARLASVRLLRILCGHGSLVPHPLPLRL